MTTATESYDSPLKSICYLIGGVFVFSLQDVIVKWISGKYPVHEIVLIRSFFAIIPLLFIANLEGGLNSLRTKHYVEHIIRSFLMFGAYISFYLSLAVLPLSETVSLFFSTPILITILSVIFLGEKVEFRSWIAVLVGFFGVIIMLKPGSKMIEPAAFLALLAAFLYAIVSIITRRLGKTESGVSLAFYPTVMYIIFSTILSISLNNIAITQKSHSSWAFLFREWQFPSQGDLFLFVIIGLISAAGFYFISQAYRLGQPSTIAPFEYIAVPLSVVWGYIFWKDILEPQSVIGIVLIVGSGLYIFGSKKLLTNKYVLSIFKIKNRR
ncbi:MAG: EamA family transporter [Deltaproteobacteria bacterium]|nr:EamA family transporter [Deltaproteobacteria bacterium]